MIKVLLISGLAVALAFADHVLSADRLARLESGVKEEQPPAAKTKENLVELAILGGNDFPKGCPVVLRLKMTNVGKDSISWWSGGPDRFPGAEHFVVEVRYGSGPWNEVKATNGQYTAGSGNGASLGAGQSIEVPLAIPLKNSPEVEVDVRIRPREWKVAKDAEMGLIVQDSPRQLDEFRARLISASVHSMHPFEIHLAQTYADSFVIDSLVKLMDLKNRAIRKNITNVLAYQQELSAASSATFAKVVRECSTTSLTDASAPWPNLMTAALRTKGEDAREAVLGLLDPSNPGLCTWTADALRLSPGDEAWLRRAREAIVAVEKQVARRDAEAAKSLRRDIEWLDSRIKQRDR